MRNQSVFSRVVVVAFLSLLPLIGSACIDQGNSEFSSTTQDISGPPATVTATVASPTSITVSWSTVADAVKYYIFQQTNGGPSTYVGTVLAPGTSRTLTGLTPGTYTYTIVAAASDGSESAPSSSASATLGSSAGAPTNITATPVSSTQIDVAFTTVANALKYYLFQSTSGGAFVYIGTIVDPGNSRSVTGLTGSTNYCYELQTEFKDGSQSALSAPVCANTNGGPGAPTGVTATAISDTRINVQWNAATGAAKYFVYESAAGGSAPFTQVGTVFTPTTSYLAVNLTANTKYCFEVSTVLADGTESSLSGAACATTLSTGSGGFEAIYRFDERSGSVAGDSSGFNRTATLSGGAAFSTTDRAQIDDNQSSVNIPAAASATVTAAPAPGFNLVGSFGVTFWTKIQAAGDARFLGMHDANCGALGYEIGQNSGGLYFAGEGGQVVSFGSTLPVGTWANVAVSYSNGTMQTYVNGVATGTGAYTPQNTAQTSLMMGHPGGCASTAINLDQVTIYSRALTASEVAVQGTLPPAPTNLTISSATSVSETLTWTAVPNATSYILSKGTMAGNEQFYTHIPAGTTYSPDHLTPGTQYSWTVRAVVNGLFSAPSNSAVGSTNGGPAAPVNVVATALSSSRINVTWNAVTNAAKYYVFISTGGGAYTFAGSLVAGSSPSFLAVNLAANTTYSFEVQAEDSAQTTSPMSAPATATTMP